MQKSIMNMIMCSGFLNEIESEKVRKKGAFDFLLQQLNGSQKGKKEKLKRVWAKMWGQEE